MTNAVKFAASFIASVTFAVRVGTAGLYSDLALTDVQLGEKTGVKDVFLKIKVESVQKTEGQVE